MYRSQKTVIWYRRLIAGAWLLLTAGLAAGIAVGADAVGAPPSDVAGLLHQYGLAGLAALLVGAQWRSHERMAAALDRHETLLIEMVKANAELAAKSGKVIESLERELRERPCLRAEGGK